MTFVADIWRVYGDEISLDICLHVEPFIIVAFILHLQLEGLFCYM